MNAGDFVQKLVSFHPVAKKIALPFQVVMHVVVALNIYIERFYSKS